MVRPQSQRTEQRRVGMWLAADDAEDDGDDEDQDEERQGYDQHELHPPLACPIELLILLLLLASLICRRRGAWEGDGGEERSGAVELGDGASGVGARAWAEIIANQAEKSGVEKKGRK